MASGEPGSPLRPPAEGRPSVAALADRFSPRMTPRRPNFGVPTDYAFHIYCSSGAQAAARSLCGSFVRFGFVFAVRSISFLAYRQFARPSHEAGAEIHSGVQTLAIIRFRLVSIVPLPTFAWA